MNNVLNDFQNSLRDGMSLWDALEKYNISLKYAMDHLDKPMTKPRKKPDCRTVNKHIYRIGKYYTVQKSVRNHSVNFGTYNTLGDALRVRDYFLRNGWNRKRLDDVCELLGVCRRVKL